MDTEINSDASESSVKMDSNKNESSDLKRSGDDVRQTKVPVSLDISRKVSVSSSEDASPSPPPRLNKNRSASQRSNQIRATTTGKSLGSLRLRDDDDDEKKEEPASVTNFKSKLASMEKQLSAPKLRQSSGTSNREMNIQLSTPALWKPSSRISPPKTPDDPDKDINSNDLKSTKYGTRKFSLDTLSKTGVLPPLPSCPPPNLLTGVSRAHSSAGSYHNGEQSNSSIDGNTTSSYKVKRSPSDSVTSATSRFNKTDTVAPSETPDNDSSFLSTPEKMSPLNMASIDRAKRELQEESRTPIMGSKAIIAGEVSFDQSVDEGGSEDWVVPLETVRRRLSRAYKQDDDECVGFASLPEQVHRKAVKRGFDFTLMVVGETGLGKSTLISSLFLNPDLYKEREIPSVIERITKTVQVEKKYMEIEEKGVKLRLTIVDTPGFNDSMDAEQSWKPIEDYINHQFDQYFKDETGLNRKNIKDHRVHCCLYFVSPYGHGLRPIDVQFMKRLHDKVNIVPIIAKADTLTQAEVRRLKDKVLDQVEQHRIRIYEFPDCDSDEDEDFKKQDSELKASIPFAVIGSNTVVEVQGRKVRGRLYPWGVVEVDNPQHCDFSKLRMMLISTHMQDLKDVTRDIHYENFRARHIKEQMTKNQRERNKLKRDSSPNFESIIDQDKLLEAKDEEIRRMQEMIIKMQAQLQGKGPGSNGPVPVVGLGNL